MSTKIQLRRDTSANWTSANPTLFSGEIGYETNTGKFKIGNGSTVWSGLDYFVGGEIDLSGYLTLSSASNTYLTQTSASSTYLTQTSASSNYLNQSSASTTYLTQASASTSYVTKSGDSSISGSLSLTQNSRTTSPLTINAIAPLTATITSASYSAGTYTFTATNTFSAGDIVTITGCIPQNFNLSKVSIATANSSSFTVTLTQESGFPTSTTTGGTATRVNANLLEFKNSSGTSVAAFDQNGILSTAGTLIASSTFSNANNVNFKNVFSSNYSWYRVVCSFTSWTAGTALFRLVSGSTLYSSAEYSQTTLQVAGAASGFSAAVAGSAINNTGITAGINLNDGWLTSEVDLYFPESARRTSYNVRSWGANTSWTSLGILNNVQGIHQQAVAMDSLNVFHASSVSITGIINIYGMR